MGYDIVQAEYITDLKIRVGSLINQGWIPQGGVGWDNDMKYYMQAMIKYSTTGETK